MSEPVEDAAESAVAPDDAIVLDEDLVEDAGILTIPNLITVIRLCTLPVFVYLLFGADDRWAAGWVLFLIGSTDWLDGYLARRLGQVSNVGKVLDPVADRLLFFVGVGSIIIDGSVPLWFAVAVLVREAAVAIGTVSLAALGASRIDVTWYGKAATFALMGAFPSFLVGASDHATADGFRVLAWVVGVPGLALAYWSALLYIPLGRKALAEGRQVRADRSAA
ncbi:CDP-alcohol phosphatidyltransferase family protein [Acidimicrobiia bacterium EGI L10123]|uniref:CDP-alcohol phosphatidyltransferase family protein n=1 Tax=Salinilacustrithrix flava TaxID=2957203 RepID=UPI003D7C247A|nr:CDP-alcohol phosphatidyltransferase family protein [Acidimicrobiia bacterium EGI L10123]